MVFAFYHPFFGTPEGPTGEFHGWNGVTRLGDFVPGLPLIEKLDEDVARCFKPDPKQLIGTERPDTYYGDSHVVHIGEKLPVLLYSPLGKHTIEDWKSIRALLKKRGVRELMLVAGELGPQPEHARLFDGVSSYATCVRNLTEDGVRGFYSHLATIAKESGGFLGLPISPGFNVRIWARPGTHEPRRGGETYKMGWRLASEFNPDWYLICSWNEWGEGTQIEPDCDFGALYLDLTREMVRKYVRKV